MNLKNLLRTLVFAVFFVVLGQTAFAQQTWYVNNGPTGNDGRNGLAATIPVPDDFVTGPKKTINNAMSAANDGDTIVIANTGVDYGTGTGEPATLAVSKKLTFQSTGGTVNIATTSLFQVVTGALANNVTFNSGAYALKGGLTMTSGTLVTNGLVTVNGGTITVAAVNTTTKVTGQLLYSGTVNFSYGANYTTADEFPSSGTIGTLTTTAGALTLKTSTLTINGNISTAGTLNLGGNSVSLTNTGGATTHTFGGNVSNGTLAFTLTQNATVNGAFTLPTVSVTTASSTARTLALAQPTAVTGTLSVSGAASVTTSAALITIGTSGYTGNALSLDGSGIVTVSGSPTTVHGNVLLSSAVTAATGSQINFAAATTINGNVTNGASLAVTNANTWNGATSGLISFADANVTITGTVLNNTSISGTLGTTLDADGFGLITFANAATTITINGQLNNTSSTSLSGSTNPTDLSGNGLITMLALTSGDVRIDGGINNSSNWASATGAANVNNGRILIGAAGTRTTGSMIGSTSNRVGLITNSSLSPAAADGNGDIIIDGDNASDGFFGTSVTVSGSAKGGYTKFDNEIFNVNGNVTNSRTQANTTLEIGSAATAAHTVTVGGNIVNSGTGTTSFGFSQTGAVAVTGSIQSTANGTITFPNITSGAFTLGGLSVSAGTVTVPATHTAVITINGNVDISGGTVTLANDGSNPTITVSGTSASFTGGTITTTGVTSLTLNVANITVGGATANPTFAPATTVLTVGNPTPSVLVNFAIGNANPSLAGALTVNNVSGLAKAVEFSGGSMVIAGKLTFTAGKVNVAGAANLIVQSNTGAADFSNTAGYTTADNARITVNANAPAVTGAGDFGNIEFNGTGGTIALGSAIKVTGTVYLTNGPVNNTVNNIDFDNSTTLPTIVRNSGYFLAVPTFTSNVNVTYIGGDKTSGNELPTTATKLQNLTVATSTGNTAGKGAVTIGQNATVNGTLTVNANQALVIDNTFTLTMKGASIVANGDIANNGTGMLTFGATNGTTVTGGGYLPSVTIAAGSSGNVIAAKALVNNLLGADNIRGGVADFDQTTTSASGNLTMGAGTATGTLTLTGVTFDGTGLTNITTAHANNTLTLGADTKMAGNFAHVAGTIDLGGFTLTHLGTAPSITGGALTTNGTLTFGNGTSTGATLLSLVTADVTVAANVNINLGAAATTFTIDPANAGNLVVTGTFTVTKGDVVLGNGGAARNVTVKGTTATLTSNGTIDVTPTGIGTFILDATTAPLTLSYTGTPSIARLQIKNDVVLGGSGTALTVSTLFTHTAGNLNFGSKNLTFKTAFTRVAGTYSATTGYMIIDANAAWTVDQGDGFSIPNLKFTASAANNLALSNAAGRGSITVTSALDLVLAAQTLTTNGKLAVADGATVNYTSGALSAAPAYAGGITLVANGTANGAAFSAFVWPSTANLVQTLTINAAAAGNTITIPGNRTIYGTNTLNLTQGVLTLAANTLTLVSGTTINRTENGSVTKTTGGIAFPADNNVNLVYKPTAASAGGDITTGIEFPSVMNNLTITRTGNVANALVTLGSAATVNGTLTINNNLTATAQLTAVGNVVIATDGTNTNATAPTVTFAQAAPLVFGGADGQTLSAAGQTIGWMKLNMTGTNPALNVTGNLTIANTGALVFTNGILNMGTYTLTLPRPASATQFGGLAYDRSGVTGTNVGHVVGKIARAANSGDGASGVNGRFEFPSGTLSGQYRPAAITFTPSYVVGNPVTIVVSHVDESPGGTVNLPLDGGNGIKIGNYPNFYWLVSTTPSSLTSTQGFDVDFQANNIGYPYASDSHLRILRRQDGSAESNGWLMQGTAANYANYQVVNGTDTTVIARTVSSQGGLVLQGSRFTIGVPTRAPSFTAPVAATASVNENETATVQFTADANDVGETVTYSIVTGPAFATINTTTGLVTLAPDYTQGSTTPYTLTVRATDTGGASSDKTIAVTVVNVNRAPSFTATGAVALADKTVKSGDTYLGGVTAVDSDGGTLTYTVDSVTPALAGTLTITGAATGAFEFKPVFADAGKVFDVVIKAADADGGSDTTTAKFTVSYPVALGDVDGNGSVGAADASEILKYVVGLVTFTDQQKYAANVNGDAEIGALDAAWVLYYVANGSWPSGAKMNAVAGLVEFGQISSENGVINMPINITATNGVLSAYTEISINDQVEVSGVTARLPEGWTMVQNVANNKVRIAMAGLTPLTEGTYAVVGLKLKDKEAVVNISGLANLNDQLNASLSANVREIPSEFALSQNYPNPFNPTTTIKFAVSEKAPVTLNIYNMLGQKVKTLVDSEQEAGFYTVNWDGTNDFGSRVASGIYIYRITAGKFTSTMKMNLLK